MSTGLRKQRIGQVRERLASRGIEAALLTSPTTLLYLTGFQSDPMERFLGLWVPAAGETLLFVPELDAAKALKADNVGRIVPLADSESPYGALLRECGQRPAHCGLEKKSISLHVSEQLEELWGETRFHEVGGDIGAIIGRKTREEADLIGRAARIANEAVEAAVKDLRTGMTERDVAEKILLHTRLCGGDGPAFAPTVLAGVRSGLPHGETGDTPIREGDFLLVDMGVSYGNYLSDMTRTFLIGEGTKEQERIYETVKEANRRAIAAIRPGVPLSEIDDAARSWIASRGYGDRFIHRVGHGLGMAIHEDPSIHGRNSDVVSPGMLFTIEPGIYVPGIGGVRIEDDLYVNDLGETERLTDFSRELRRL